MYHWPSGGREKKTLCHFITKKGPKNASRNGFSFVNKTETKIAIDLFRIIFQENFEF